MKVLVACEFSQVVQSAFKEHGCDAWSCDLIPTIGSDPEHHIIADAREVVLNNSWDLVIAHPPCTYLCIGSACRMYSKKGQLNYDRFKKAMAAKEFFMFFYNLDCKVCVENPRPLKVVGLPDPSMIVNPCDFGDDYTKETYLWLKRLPIFLPSFQGFGFDSLCDRYHDAKRRSIFSKGIATAMAVAWCE